MILVGCQHEPANQTAAQDHFRWLDNTRDAQVWNRVQAAFRHELEPDDPRNVPPHYLPTQYKYIYQIGVFRTAALVIIRYRETKDSPYDYFNAYSHDLNDGSKRAIVTEPPKPSNVYPQADVLWLFKVAKLAQFDQSPAPDVVFTYDACTECESDHFLGSFEYDASSRNWKARQWDKETSLLLASDPSPDDNALSSDYLFKIKDWNGDGLDEVAVRRRTVTQIGKRSKETDDVTAIYSAEEGKLVGHRVTDLKEREGINADLCRGSDLAFCQQHE